MTSKEIAVSGVANVRPRGPARIPRIATFLAGLVLLLFAFYSPLSSPSTAYAAGRVIYLRGNFPSQLLPIDRFLVNLYETAVGRISTLLSPL
jgi:hypothetical protein